MVYNNVLVLPNACAIFSNVVIGYLCMYVDMIESLVPDPPDGAHHPALSPATLQTPHLSTLQATSTRLQVNLLIFICQKKRQSLV